MGLKLDVVAWLVGKPHGMHAIPRSIPASGSFFCEDLFMKIFLYSHSSSLLIQEEQLSVNFEKNQQRTRKHGKLPSTQ